MGPVACWFDGLAKSNVMRMPLSLASFFCRAARMTLTTCDGDRSGVGAGGFTGGFGSSAKAIAAVTDKVNTQRAVSPAEPWTVIARSWSGARR